jgi:hypothetical protein
LGASPEPIAIAATGLLPAASGQRKSPLADRRLRFLASKSGRLGMGCRRHGPTIVVGTEDRFPAFANVA